MSDLGSPPEQDPFEGHRPRGRRSRRDYGKIHPDHKTQRFDDEAFNSLYREHSADIKRLCRSILHDETDAEDAAQEAFAKAWGALRSGLDQQIYPWLRVVARNHCYDVLRKRGRSHPADATVIEAIGPSLEGSDRSVMAGIEGELARESLRRTSQSHQDILVLREALELSYQEIAEREEIPLSSVESRLYRARRALRKEYLALVGPDGVAAAIWLRCRGWFFDSHVIVAQGLGGTSVGAASTGAVPAGTVGKVVAAGALAAVATLVPVHLALQHPAPRLKTPVALAPTPELGPAPTTRTVVDKKLTAPTGGRVAPAKAAVPTLSQRHHRLASLGSAAALPASPSGGATPVISGDASSSDAASTSTASGAPASSAPGADTSGGASSTPATLTAGVSTTPAATEGSGAAVVSAAVTTIAQGAPFSSVTTTASSAASIDQLNVGSGARGAVTFTEQSGAPLLVSSTGTVSSNGHLATGTYVVTGTDRDGSGDTGKWSYVLRVRPVTIVQSGSTTGSAVFGSTGGYTAQLSVADAAGVPVSFVQQSYSFQMGLLVSPSGTVTTTGQMYTGGYLVSGTDSDALGDTGTWSYTLSVVAYVPQAFVSTGSSSSGTSTPPGTTSPAVGDASSSPSGQDQSGAGSSSTSSASGSSNSAGSSSQGSASDPQDGWQSWYSQWQSPHHSGGYGRG